MEDPYNALALMADFCEFDYSTRTIALGLYEIVSPTLGLVITLPDVAKICCVIASKFDQDECIVNAHILPLLQGGISKYQLAIYELYILKLLDWTIPH
jgi:hypothetical protein